MAKNNPGEVTGTFYGINRETNEVESVDLTRDGHLVKYNREGVPRRVPVRTPSDPRSEVVTVFGLIDVISVPPPLENSETTKRRIAELKEKAKARKAESEGS